MQHNYKANEKQIQAACDALRDGSVGSIREAAKLFAVARAMLSPRMTGQRSALGRFEAQQRLTKGEETAIVKAVYALERWGWLMSIKYL